MSKTHIGTKI